MDHAVAISLVIIAVRILAPLTLLRWPIAGVVINIIVDDLDLPVAQHFGWGLFGNGHYQYLDKLLDTWYLCFLFFLMCQWADPLARRTGKVLFFWRLVGVCIFEATGWRHALVFFPNIAEYFYLFWAIVLKWFSRFKLTTRRLIIILLVIGIPQTAHEVLMHWLYPDISLRTLLRERFIPWLLQKMAY